jgi:integrase
MRNDPGKRQTSGQLVFPGVAGTPFAGWSKAKAALDKAIIDARAKAVKGDSKAPTSLNPWSVHDLRRTLATGLQRLGVRLEVTEAVLNHISGSRGGIAGVYQRHVGSRKTRCARRLGVPRSFSCRGPRYHFQHRNAVAHCLTLGAGAPVQSLRLKRSQ